MFTPGTFIATERGQRPVEQLQRGDRIVTRDNGLKRITWIGRRNISYKDLNQIKGLRPVLIKKGALGGGRPERDMLVSPRHRLFVRAHDALMSARELIDHRQIVPAPSLGVSYLHLMCNTREVALANGAWAECVHPDDPVAASQTPKQRREILILFPEVATMGAAKRVKATKEEKGELSRFET